MQTIQKSRENQSVFYIPQSNEIELFEYAHHHQLPLLIKGPTGCGKTRFIQFMAEKLKLPLYTVACHDDLTASDLVGRHLIGAGDTIWQDGPLTRAVRNGGICYLDEVIEARKDTTVVIHPLTDDRRILPIDRTAEIIKAPDDFMLILSYNPGYQSLMKGLKPSTRQRFLAMSFGYPDSDKEIEIVVEESGIDEVMASRLVTLAQALRRLKDVDLDEGASTRLLVYLARLIKDGFDPIQACQAAIVEPLTDEVDTAKALMEVIYATFGA